MLIFSRRRFQLVLITIQLSLAIRRFLSRRGYQLRNPCRKLSIDFDFLWRFLIRARSANCDFKGELRTRCVALKIKISGGSIGINAANGFGNLRIDGAARRNFQIEASAARDRVVVNLRARSPHITLRIIAHGWDCRPGNSSIPEGHVTARVCTRMHTYPRALVTGWRSTAPPSNREPNVSLCFDWSPPDRGSHWPFRPSAKRFPVVFCVVSPSRFLVILLPPSGIRRRHPDVYLSGVNVDRSCRQGWRNAISLTTAHAFTRVSYAT